MLTGSFCHKLGQWTLNWAGTCSQERGANSLSILCTAKVGVAEHCPEIRHLRGPHVLCLANVPGLRAFQGLCLCITGGFPRVAQRRRICLPVRETQEAQVQFLGQEDPLEKETAAHSSILTWEIPRTEDPGGLQSMGLQTRIRLSY